MGKLTELQRKLGYLNDDNETKTISPTNAAKLSARVISQGKASTVTPTLKQTADDAELEAYRANARAQAMLANPLTADMKQYADLKTQADRASQTATKAKSDLALRRQYNANEEAESKISALVSESKVAAGPTYLLPSYTAADRNEVDHALRIIRNPDAAASLVGAEDIWNATRLYYLTDEERAALETFAKAGNYGKASELLDNLSRVLNQRQTAAASKRIQQEAEESPLLGAAGNVLFSYAQPLAYLEGLKQGVANLATGEEATIDPNSFLMSGANLTQAAQQGTVEAVNKAVGRDVSFLTNTGLSILQNVSRLPMGAAALPYMAVSAAGASTLEGTRKGLDTDETLALATLAGAAEAITEKIPLDNLLRNLKEPGKAATAIFKQMATEGAEEAVSEYLNLAADIMVRGANSDMLQTMENLQESGYSASDAFQQAFVEYAVKDPALAALGGAISGGILGGVTTFVGSRANRAKTPQNESGLIPDAVTLAQAETARDSAQAGSGIKKDASLDGGGRGASRIPSGVSSDASSSGSMLPQPENIFKSEEVLVANENGAPLIQTETAIQGYDGPLRNDTPLGESVDSLTDSMLPQAEMNVNPEVGPESSVGAAQRGFAGAYDQLLGASAELHPPGETPSRLVDVPTTNLQGQAIPKSAQTVLESRLLDDESAAMILEQIAGGAFGSEVFTDAAAVEQAENTIRDLGWASALNHFLNDAEQGRVSKSATALGAVLFNNAAQNKDAAAVMDILNAYTRMSRASAQAMQAQRILKKLTPAGKLYGIQRSVSRLQNDLQRRYADKAPNIKIDESLAQEFLDATSDEQRDAVLDKIYRNIADQIPSTWQDKWNAWRYLAMLGNFRTHIRNVVGNLFFQPVRAAKDRVAAALELTVDAIDKARGGEGIERSKSFVSSPALFKAAWKDFLNLPESMRTGSKYSETEAGKISEYQRAFKTDRTNPVFRGIMAGLNAAAQTNTALLGAEDGLFKRWTYAGEMAGYLKAHGVTAAQMEQGAVDDTLLEKARAYASTEALKATYNDRNAFSDFVSSIGGNLKHTKNPVARAAGTVVEGVLPFKRTPANILMRGIEYSPVGFVKALVESKTGAEASQVIDSVASALTGSGLMLAGYLLASIGALTVPDEDEEQSSFNDLIGQQNYALQLPNGVSITLDWLAPEVLPIFIGANLAELGGEEGFNVRTLFDAVSRISDPLLEMSMLQSLNDIVESGKYSDSPTASIMWSVLTSYLTQGIPTALGQAERTWQKEGMTTYTGGEGALPGLDRFLGKTSARLPGWDYNQIPYINAWGERENTGSLPYRAFNNFLNPAYISNREMDATETELQRLYDAGETNVFPSRADKSFEVNGATYRLSAEEYAEYAETKGQTAKETLDRLTRASFYKEASDSEKADMISKVYSYANAYAKKQVNANYQTTNKMVKIALEGGDVLDYLKEAYK